MNPKLLMTAAGIFIIGTLLACLASGRWLLGGETNIINALASFNYVGVSSGEGSWTMPQGIALYWDAIVTMLSWNYPFLANPWCLILKIPLWLISIGVVVGLIQLFIYLIQSAISLARSLIPTGG